MIEFREQEPWSRCFKDLDKLRANLENLSKSKKIVYTYGAWDLLHPGHLKMIHRARELGDFLIVAVVSDSPIQDLKGSERPVQNEEARLLNIGNLRGVDAAIIQKIYDPSEELLQLGRINFLVKGDDWDYIPGQETIEKMGGELVKLSYTSGFSTSSLVKKISKSVEK